MKEYLGGSCAYFPASDIVKFKVFVCEREPLAAGAEASEIFSHNGGLECKVGPRIVLQSHIIKDKC